MGKQQQTIKLDYSGEFSINVKKPFNFRYTLWKPSHFKTDLEQHSVSTTWRTFRINEYYVGAKMRIKGNKLIVEVYSDTTLETIIDPLRYKIELAYGLNESLNSFYELGTKNKKISALIKKLFGMKISCPESFFEISVISLLLQNTTIQRSTQMMEHLLNNYGKTVEFDQKKLRIFFTPLEVLNISEQEFREKCRLGYRAKYLPEFAKFYSKHSDLELLELNRNELINTLQEIKGVGPYTAGIVASHILRDPDSLALDVWNTKIIGKYLFDNENISMIELQNKIKKKFPGFSALVGLYIIEDLYLETPLDNLIN